MLKGKSLLDYTNLFSPSVYNKNDKNTKIFAITKKILKNYIVLFAVNIIPLRKNISFFYYLQ